MRPIPVDGARVRTTALLLALTLLPAAGAAAPPVPPIRLWVHLPRAAEGSAEPVDLPYPPAPSPRALHRRALRGDPDAVAALAQGPDPAALRRACGAATRVRHVSRWLSAVSLEASPEGVAQLLGQFGPQALRPMRTLRTPRTELALPLRAAVEPTTEGAGDASGATAPARGAAGLDYGPSAAQLVQLQVDRLHAEGFTGQGIAVLVLDTGYRTTHPALWGRAIAAEYDFVFDDPVTANEPADPPGQDGHGTGVLAVLAGHAPGQLIGAAYGATLLLAKTEAVGSETRVEEDHFVAALEWGEAWGADVATASLSYLAFDDGFSYLPGELDGDTGVTTRAMDAAAALGVVPVCAVGNRGNLGPSSLGTPADADSAASVGAVDSVGTLANFSSRGPTADGRIKPDVCARGVAVRWAIANGGFGDASGTSLAAPLVAGTAALLLEAHPEWSAQQVIGALRATATQAGSPDNARGYGIVQAHDAAFLVNVPQWPFPFDEVAPPADATGDGGPTLFSWRSARDLQDSNRVRYTIHMATSLAFADTLALFPAGTDTARVLQAFPALTFAWRVLARDPLGHLRASPGRLFHSPVVMAAPGPGAAPRAWAGLLAPYPNPFNPSVSCSFRLDRPARIELAVHDATGRTVRRLIAGSDWPAGRHQVEWDGCDRRGLPVASGVYVLSLQATAGAGPAVRQTARLTLVR